MWDGISKGDVLEAAGRNLVVIVGVTPRPETILSGVGKDRRVIKVGGICFHIRSGTE